jgi:hypothetical protein
VNINTECIGNTHHVKPKWLEKFNEIHFLSSKWVGKLGARVITLRPWASLYEVVRAAHWSSPQSSLCFWNSVHIITCLSLGLQCIAPNRIFPSCSKMVSALSFITEKKNSGCYISILSGTGSAIWLKTNFEPTGQHHSPPRSSLLPRICTVPSASTIFLNAAWMSCSVSVFSTAFDSASITSVVSKWWAFNWWNRKITGVQIRRVGWVGDNSHIFGQKFPGRKGIVRQCIVVMQQRSGWSLCRFSGSHHKTSQ